MQNMFFDIGIIIIIATIFAYIARFLKQPLIPAYVITGIIIGPVLGLITDTSTIIVLSEIGIAFLLFIVGLEIDLKKLKNIGPIAPIGGTIQIVTLFTFGFLLAAALGYIQLEAIYLGLIIAFSSTMVVLKLLSDKRELDTLHGRIIIGILLTEDFFAILAISLLPVINNVSVYFLFWSIIKGISVFLVAIYTGKYLFPQIFKFAARSQELLFLMALTTCFLFSLLFNYIGFSIAIGAFVAGITLANLPYNIEIIGKVTSLKDFFSTLFFVSLGMQLLIGSFKFIVVPLVILTLFVIVMKPLITSFLCSFFGYKRRTSFYTAMSLAQTSEFSLIIVSQGLILGHISQGIFTIAVLVALITITLTSYYIKFDRTLYHKFAKKLKILDRLSGAESDIEYKSRRKVDVILVGHNRIGYSISKTILDKKRKLLVVDFNPEIIRNLIRRNIACIYGDIGDNEILERLPLKKAKMVISTIPEKRDNMMLIRRVKEKNDSAAIFVTANKVDDALKFYDAGADYVILPHFLGGEHISLLIEDYSQDIKRIIEKKLNHIKELKERQSIGHEHPIHHEKKD